MTPSTRRSSPPESGRDGNRRGDETSGCERGEGSRSRAITSFSLTDDCVIPENDTGGWSRQWDEEDEVQYSKAYHQTAPEIVVLAGKSHPSFYEDPFWIDDKGGGKRRPNQERPDAFSRLSYAEEDPEWMDCKNGWESQKAKSFVEVWKKCYRRREEGEGGRKKKEKAGRRREDTEKHKGGEREETEKGEERDELTIKYAPEAGQPEHICQRLRLSS
eukprot:1032149-Rhodomonas_salina.1